MLPIQITLNMETFQEIIINIELLKDNKQEIYNQVKQHLQIKEEKFIELFYLDSLKQVTYKNIQESNLTAQNSCKIFVVMINQHYKIHDDNGIKLQIQNQEHYRNPDAFDSIQNLIIQNKEDMVQDSVSNKKYKCYIEKCRKSFSNIKQLVQHQKIHLKERPYKCSYQNCDKQFMTKGHLKNHEDTHLEIKQHQCRYPGCDKTYSRIQRLEIHEKTHSGQKEFICPYQQCGRAFSEKGNLKTHLRVHTGERPYFCYYQNCNKTFSTQGHLNDHLKKHSEGKIKTNKKLQKIKEEIQEEEEKLEHKMKDQNEIVGENRQIKEQEKLDFKVQIVGNMRKINSHQQIDFFHFSPIKKLKLSQHEKSIFKDQEQLQSNYSKYTKTKQASNKNEKNLIDKKRHLSITKLNLQEINDDKFEDFDKINISYKTSPNQYFSPSSLKKPIPIKSQSPDALQKIKADSFNFQIPQQPIQCQQMLQQQSQSMNQQMPSQFYQQMYSFPQLRMAPSPLQNIFAVNPNYLICSSPSIIQASPIISFLPSTSANQTPIQQEFNWKKDNIFFSQNQKFLDDYKKQTNNKTNYGQNHQQKFP